MDLKENYRTYEPIVDDFDNAPCFYYELGLLFFDTIGIVELFYTDFELLNTILVYSIC